MVTSAFGNGLAFAWCLSWFGGLWGTHEQPHSMQRLGRATWTSLPLTPGHAVERSAAEE